MECKITGDAVVINEVFYDGVTEQPVDTDFTLPDYCPDIGKILKCRATPRITLRALKKDQLTVEGVTRLEVIYLDGRDKHIRCCEHEVPFSVKIPLNNCPETAVAEAAAKVEYINCRAVSQRKIDIHGAFSLRISVTLQKTNDVLTNVEGAGIMVKKQQCEISTVIGRTQAAFSISEALELASGKPPIASVVRTGALLKIAECKPISNKLILKGEAILKVVYTTEPEGKVESMEYLLPFNQFLDMAGVDDSCETACRAEISSMEINLRTDSDGEYRRMSVDIRAFADASAYKNRSVSMISDAYSVECELDTERRYMEFERYCGTASGKTNCVGLIDTGKELSQILDSWCELGGVETNLRGGKVYVSGKTMFYAIAECIDGDKEFVEKSVPFEYEISLPYSISEGHAVCDTGVTGCTYTISGTSKIDIKAEVSVAACVYEDIKLPCICSVTPDTSRVKNRENEPSVVIYFAEAGEELWNIAREHNASVESIQSDNDISCETLEENHMLLISVQ